MSQAQPTGLQLSDLNPNELIGVVVSGTGFKSPRLMGLAMTAMSGLFLVANFVLVFALSRYYPYLYWAAGIFLFAGPFVLVTGEPLDRGDGVPVAAWARYGLIACFVVGLLAGFGLSSLPWEAWLLSAAAQ